MSRIAELQQHAAVAARHALVAMNLLRQVESSESSADSVQLTTSRLANTPSILWCQLRLALLRGLSCRCISVGPQVEADKQLGSFLKNCQQGKQEAEDLHHAEMAAQISALRVVYQIRNGMKPQESLLQLQVSALRSEKKGKKLL